MLTGKGIWTSARGRFSHSTAEAGIVNLLASNPDFETGDATGWTLTGSAEISAPLSGTYGLRIVAGGAGVGTATSDKYPCDGETLKCLFLASAVSAVTVSVSIRFYDSTPTLLSTETVKAWSAEVIASAEYSNDIAIPANATQFDVYVNKTAPGNVPYFDNFIVLPVS